MSPLLAVEELSVAYHSRAGEVCPALADIKFEVHTGEILGVLGESGSGKSTLAGALLKLLPANGKVQQGAVRFEGRDLLQATSSELQKIRGKRITSIFQEPSMALHPTIRVGDQIVDVLGAHELLQRGALREKMLEVLATLFPSETERIANSYPHQLSGGQRQRVLLAEAIACSPALLIADEPTASLDSATQLEILSLLRTLQERLNLAIVFITHQPAILAGLADRVLILYAGRVVEIGPAQSVLRAPQHPYTKALLRCLPSPVAEATAFRVARLAVIPGDPPNLARFANGCRFEPRCSERMDVCTAREPQEVSLSGSHNVACFRHGG